MTAASLIKHRPQNGLQPVDLARHLGGIAELIELCFSAEMDVQGRNLVREMRFLSHTGPALKLLNALLLGQQPWNMGFVWVEAGRVIGTVSTQRARPRSSTWLVANVAVHPDHRRRGIAAAMMRATLDLIQGQGGTEAILQVDEDNRGAIELYRRLGFVEITTHATWVRGARAAPPPYQPSSFDIRMRAPADWPEEFSLAALVRPEGLAWNEPLRPQNFRPDALRKLDLFLTGRVEEHWVVEGLEPGRLAGSLIVRTGGPDGDALVMLVHPQFRGQLERALLVRGLRRLGTRPWPARIEHPARDEHATQVLRELGFQPRRALRWLRADVRARQARAP